jgi:hypothetical protein
MTPIRIGWLELQSSLNGALLCFGKGSVKHDENPLGWTFEWYVNKDNVLVIRPDHPREQAFFDLHQEAIERMVREAVHTIAAKITKVALL